MSVLDGIKNLVGAWKGQNRLWLSPKDSPDESTATATVAVAAGGKFVIIEYTWARQGRPQEGLLMLGYEAVLTFPCPAQILDASERARETHSAPRHRRDNIPI